MNGQMSARELREKHGVVNSSHEPTGLETRRGGNVDTDEEAGEGPCVERGGSAQKVQESGGYDTAAKALASLNRDEGAGAVGGGGAGKTGSVAAKAPPGMVVKKGGGCFGMKCFGAGKPRGRSGTRK